jgi:hypothetical protein
MYVWNSPLIFVHGTDVSPAQEGELQQRKLILAAFICNAGAPIHTSFRRCDRQDSDEGDPCSLPQPVCVCWGRNLRSYPADRWPKFLSVLSPRPVSMYLLGILDTVRQASVCRACSWHSPQSKSPLPYHLTELCWAFKPELGCEIHLNK